MIIRTLSSRWGTGSDLSFLPKISCEQQTVGPPDRMPCRLLLFLFLLLLPLPELQLPFLALEKGLNLGEQHPCQGIHLMERDAGAIVIEFLLCQILSSIFLVQNYEGTSSLPFVYILMLSAYTDRVSCFLSGNHISPQQGLTLLSFFLEYCTGFLKFCQALRW